ncbi:hypothetical protein BD779DRAFT_1673838 [Infundibulicybe gibba]|nr:hypothetical protein BD779DRAFT_1673838 [Infundibulicybe gibba]
MCVYESTELCHVAQWVSGFKSSGGRSTFNFQRSVLLSDPNHATKHTQKDYTPHLLQEINQYQQILPVDEFLKLILSCPDDLSEKKIDLILADEQFVAEVNAYMKPVKGEQERYRPFVCMLNRLAAVASKHYSAGLGVQFARNDPTIIRGSAAKRKPDTFGGDLRIFRDPPRKVEDMHKRGPSTDPLHWGEPSTFAELKFTGVPIEQTPIATDLPFGGTNSRLQPTSGTQGISRISSSSSAPVSSTDGLPRSAHAGGSAPATAKPSSRTHSKSMNVGKGAPIAIKPPSGTRSKSKPTLPSTTPASSTDGLPRSTHANGSAPAIIGSLSGAECSNPKSMSGSPGASLVSGRPSSNASGAGFAALATADAATRETPESQCASYALEMLSHGGLRTHVIGALVTDSSIELLYYDRSIIIKSSPFDFINDQVRLAKWVIGMIRLNAASWGFDSAIKRVYRYKDISQSGAVSKSLYNGSIMKLGPSWKLRIKDMIFNAHCIIGRATAVFLATVEKASGAEGRELVKQKKYVIVKLSNPAKSRTSETDIINHARARTSANEKWNRMLNHLPRVLYRCDRAEGRIQQALLARFGESYEMRVPKALVMEQLFPITQLINVTTVASVYQGIVEGSEWLHTECEILHRDISINNLMYRKAKNENGEDVIYGVLNDFDLALWGPAKGPQSKQHTGTKQFMSIDLLDHTRPCSHFHRHDLESIFYVMVFHLCGYHEGEEIAFPLQKWRKATGESLYESKNTLFMGVLPPATEHYIPLRKWITRLKTIFREGYLARSDATDNLEPFDEKTLGGHVTFRKFWDIINT